MFFKNHVCVFFLFLKKFRKLSSPSTTSTVLGNNMTWAFVNEDTNGSLNFTTDSYFYIEKVQTI